MNAVQRIECKNSQGIFFVMSFAVTAGEYTTSSTDYILYSQSATIDLAASTLPEGASIWPVVSAVLGKTINAPDKLVLAMNGKTAQYEVSGPADNFTITLKGIVDQPGKRPAGFPAAIPINQAPFQNWDQTITAASVWTCAPRNAQDVADACNWAAQNGYTVRPRGIMHGWSPLSVTPGLSSYDKLLLIDTTKSLNKLQFVQAGGGPAVTAGTGVTMGTLMEFLEQMPGGKGAAPGFSFPHIPAPDHLTLGGVLAINAHGTAIPVLPNDNFPTTYGSMSNRILSLTAVVTDPGSANPDQYQLKTFLRGEKDTTALMTQLGRGFITEVTLQVIDNYNLRCLSITDQDISVLFKAPTGLTPPPGSCGDYLNQSGRIEIIWFPFTTKPWLKVWTVEATQPATSRRVDGPNNYPFSDNLPDNITKIVSVLTSLPYMTEVFGSAMETFSNLGLDGKNFLGQSGAYPVSRDIWGPSKNTMLYVKDTTLRVTANGYAVLMNRSAVQQGIADFTTKFQQMLYAYKDAGKYPVNSPLEIRVTGLDSGDDMPAVNGGRADRPVISALATDAETIANNWDVALWFDVLTIPGTAHSQEFYTELEAWFLSHFTVPQARVMPEWSKGWGYTAAGPWSSQPFIDGIKKNFTTGRAADDNWAWQTTTLARYDAHNIFQSKLTGTLFS